MVEIFCFNTIINGIEIVYYEKKMYINQFK